MNLGDGVDAAGSDEKGLDGVREPLVLADPHAWSESLRTIIRSRVTETLGLSAPAEYDLDHRFYGFDAILQGQDPSTQAPRELGVMLLVAAADQATATSIAKIANPYLLHLPTVEMHYLPSFAFATSPAEIERGPFYEFVLNHVVDTPNPTAMVRIELEEHRHD